MNNNDLIKLKISYLISTFFYIGCVPVCPGTIASFVTAIITFFLPTHIILFDIFLIIFLFCVGVFCSGYLEKLFSVKDPHWIVIDEVLGMFIVLCWVDKNWKSYLILFILFRFFDITKIYPIKQIESIHVSGWGIMLDDVLASVYAIITAIIFLKISAVLCNLFEIVR